MKTSLEFRAHRATLVNEARALQNRAAAADAEMSTEDQSQFDKIMDEVDKLKAKIDRLESLESAEAEMEAPVTRSGRPIESESRSGRAGAPAADEAKLKADFRHWIRHGEVRGQFRSYQSQAAEYRDTIVGTDAKGGYLIAPRQVSDDIVKLIDDQVFIRKLATITTVTEAKKLGIRKMSTRMADADWTTEVQAATEDTTMAFDLRELEPYQVSKLAKISIKTLMLSTDAEKEVTSELAYKNALTQEKAFLTANGSSKPMGVFYASASGISTGRDVSTDNTTTAITADNLINVKYAVKQAYLADPKAGWIFHRDAVKMIRKLKNSGDGQYVWAAGLASGQPDKILDVPLYVSEHAPNTFTTGLYVGIIGNFRYYRIAELNTVFLQRLNELYAATGEVGFISRAWVDGAPVREEAFARVKLA